ncbi:hypothetical protein HOLleu_33314 [Holothuria leucospilota]|uniref:CTCK domain-containing protein n=1 Tax=Holothuria leucospilota TaxID=206669 RepID=A0A9Q0YSF3_HOLLE|nr:hypothetical protein HOLleu_33314 [Holothuria leucospilota]
MDYLVWFFILANWLACSRGFESCIQDDNPLRCGIPPLTDEQIQNIDEGRLKAIQYLLIEREGRPLALEDTSIPPEMLEPLVNLTSNQRAAFDRKYGNSSSLDVGTARRKKRGTSGEACPKSGSQTVVFALMAGNQVCQIEARVFTNLACPPVPEGNSCSGRCCVDEICVPLTCVNIHGRAIGTFVVTLTRCTCCNSNP